MADDATTPPTEPDGTAEDTPATEPVTTAKPAANDPVTAKLTELGVDADTIARIKDELGVATLDDLPALTETDLTGVGVKTIPARRLVERLKPAAPAATDAAVDTGAYRTLLPVVPDAASWLQNMKTGGVLKVGTEAYVAAIRAALADAYGLFEIPDKLVGAMEVFADATEEPLPLEFYSLQEQITRRNYADVFSAIPGFTGRQATKQRRQKLLEAIRRQMWPALIEFNGQLVGWRERWARSMADPGLMMTWLSTMGNPGSGMPAGLLMQPPDTAVLRTSSEALVNTINKVFAGMGVQIATALAIDAEQITQVLSDARLPLMVGAGNRDIMLRQLGIDVGPMEPRLEMDLVQFTLGAVQAKDQPAGTDGLAYFSALWALGTEIPWDRLGGRSPGGLTGIGGSPLDPGRIGRAAIGGTTYDAGYGPGGEPLRQPSVLPEDRWLGRGGVRGPRDS